MAARNVLVTGGAGFIGSHLVNALLLRGCRVNVLDNLSVGTRENVPASARLIEGDIVDGDTVDRALEGMDAVVHLAARVSIRDSLEHYCEDAHTNLSGTLTLLQRCGLRGIRRFIFASSMAVYADRRSPSPIPETFVQEPISPYGIAKLAAEKYTLLLSQHYGMASVCLRYFNVFGPGQSFTPYVGVITIFIQHLTAGLQPVIFGDGNQQRDFVHVEDITEATLLALDSALSGEVFNVGTGEGTSVNQIAKLLIDRLRPGIRPIYHPSQPGEIRNAIADISRIQGRLGFRPHGTLADRIDEVIEWNQRRVTG